MIDLSLATSQFTQLLLQAGINPLEYLDIVPISFLEHSDIKSFKIPDTITSIHGYAFAECLNLTAITIPDTVNDIRGYAFLNCLNLKNLEIPNINTRISINAFYGCNNLTITCHSEEVKKSIQDSGFTGDIQVI